MRGWCVAAALALALVGWERASRACSCKMDHPAISKFERPPNTWVYWDHRDGLLGGAPILRRVTEDGDAPPISLEQVENAPVDGFYRPTRRLERGEQYELVTDVWGVVQSFWVVGGVDLGAPSAAVLRSVSVRIVDDIELGNCALRAEHQTIDIDHDPLPWGVAFLLVRVRRDGEEKPFWTGVGPGDPRDTRTHLGSSACDAIEAPVIRKGETYCVSVSVGDAAGNMSAASQEVCGSEPGPPATPEETPEETPLHLIVVIGALLAVGLGAIPLLLRIRTSWRTSL